MSGLPRGGSIPGPRLAMPDASNEFGAFLRRAREQKGITLRDIADRTKISVPALEALEREDLARLPGGIFTRSFVRSFAREVGIDPEDAVRRFLSRFPDESSSETAPAYDPNPDHIEVDEQPTVGRAWRAVVWSLPLVLVVAYFWFGGRLPFWRDADSRPPAATSENAAAPGASQPAAAAPAPAASQDSGLAPGATEPVPGTSLPVDTAAGGPPAPAAEAPAPAPIADSVPPGEFLVTLASREDCWVSVRADGASVFSGLLRAGERKDLPLRGDVSLTVGNAGAVDLLVNGRTARPLGTAGQVVTVRLTLDNLNTFLEPR